MAKIVSRPPKGVSPSLWEANITKLQNRIKSTDPNRIIKAQDVNSEYLGISEDGEIYFKTSSGTTPGKYWFQTLQFPSFHEFENLYNEGGHIDYADVASVLRRDDVKVLCNDPSFLYWAWKYMAWTSKYGIEPEDRAPKRNNVALNGATCKHLYSVFELLKNQEVLKAIAYDLDLWLSDLYGVDPSGESVPDYFYRKGDEEPTVSDTDEIEPDEEIDMDSLEADIIDYIDKGIPLDSDMEDRIDKLDDVQLDTLEKDILDYMDMEDKDPDDYAGFLGLGESVFTRVRKRRNKDAKEIIS